ncbi:unnamed protein product [Psylliodes chrysocephalus]|uniref:Uncharacterized protein n=1 Tax=Psylliodes chrysocephalus TaxID=3402493 RepID=A0A9P0CVW3_9CUCU|nr:unnamed protein product [Psylliodes chrysocephala]
MHNNESIKHNRLNQFLISTHDYNPIKKIANGVKKTLRDNIFSKNVYNVRKEELKQFKNATATFSYEIFKTDLDEVKKLQQKFMNITSEEKKDINKESVEADTDEAVKNIEEVVSAANSNVNKLLHEALSNIKDNSNRRFKCFLAEIIAYSIIALEEVQTQCEENIDEMATNVKTILKNNSQKTIAREKDLKETNAALNAELNKCISSARMLEGKYLELLDSAERRIYDQEMLIGALKEEINAMEISSSMEKVLRKQKK